MELESGEMVVWRGRPAIHLRYVFLTIIFFLLLFVINLGPIGEAIGVISFFLSIIFFIVMIVSIFRDRTTKYYVTSNRIIARKNFLLTTDLISARVQQSALDKLRGTGKVYFDSRDGRWIVFKHVKDPEQIRQGAMNLRLSLPNAPIATATMLCNYCGTKVPVGVARCPVCGADLL